MTSRILAMARSNFLLQFRTGTIPVSRDFSNDDLTIISRIRVNDIKSFAPTTFGPPGYEPSCTSFLDNEKLKSLNAVLGVG
jgi:hypothetical protein